MDGMLDWPRGMGEVGVEAWDQECKYGSLERFFVGGLIKGNGEFSHQSPLCGAQRLRIYAPETRK